MKACDPKRQYPHARHSRPREQIRRHKTPTFIEEAKEAREAFFSTFKRQLSHFIGSHPRVRTYEQAYNTPTEDEIKEAQEDALKFMMLKQSVLKALITEQDRLVSTYPLLREDDKFTDTERTVGYRIGAISGAIKWIEKEECNDSKKLLSSLNELKKLSGQSTGKNLGRVGIFFSNFFEIFKSDGYKNVNKIIAGVEEFIGKEVVRKDEAIVKKYIPY